MTYDSDTENYKSDTEKAAEALIGKKILSLKVGVGEQCLVWETDQGVVIWETSADCCSETWFADIVGVATLLGGVVTSSEEVNMYDDEDQRPRQDSRCRQAIDTFYGIKITTDKGHADIVFRNSSNGYYGGSIFLIARKRVFAATELKEITADWQAA